MCTKVISKFYFPVVIIYKIVYESWVKGKKEKGFETLFNFVSAWNEFLRNIFK